MSQSRVNEKYLKNKESVTGSPNSVHKDMDSDDSNISPLILKNARMKSDQFSSVRRKVPKSEMRLEDKKKFRNSANIEE